MASRGFLIRFIDIGLIVLFGFIMISEIENASQVDLSAAAEVDADGAPATDRVFVTVGIAADGSFSVADTETGTVLAANLADPAPLSQVLAELQRRHRADGEELIVLIRPHAASIVQRTVDVMDICDRLALGKSLQTDQGRGVSEGEA